MKLRSLPVILGATALGLSTAAAASLRDYVHGSGWLIAPHHSTTSNNVPPLDDAAPMEMALDEIVEAKAAGHAKVNLKTSEVKAGSFALRVRFSKDSDMDVVNQRVANAIASTAQANGASAFAIVSRDCKSIRSFDYAVECRLTINLV